MKKECGSKMDKVKMTRALLKKRKGKKAAKKFPPEKKSEPFPR